MNIKKYTPELAHLASEFEKMSTAIPPALDGGLRLTKA